MIGDGGFKNRQIAKAADCRTGAVKRIKRNICDFDSTTRPGHRGGRPSTITPTMREALLAHLDEHPELYLEEMVENL